MLGRLPKEVEESIQLAAMREALEEMQAEAAKDDLQGHLNKRVVRAYLSKIEENRWIDAAFPPEGVLVRKELADELLNTAWERYRQAIRKYGNPRDQIERYEKAGIILQDKQLQFASAARKADSIHFANEIGLGGARGPGKSFSVFAQAVVDDCQRFPGLKVLYLRKSGKAASEQILDLLRTVLARMTKGVDFDYRERPNFKIEFPNGSYIVVGHFQTESEALNYQGLEYDLLIVEELTHLSENGYKDLRTNVRSSKEGWRPRTYNSTNPLGSGHKWYKKRFVDPERRKVPFEERENKTYFIFATVDDNRFVNEEYVKNLDDLTGVKKEAFRLGNWDVSAGAYFSTWNYEKHVIDDFEEIPNDMQIWAAMDYGFGHWNAVLLFGKVGETRYILHELRHRHRFPSQIAPDIHKMLAKYGKHVQSLMYFLAGADVFRQTGHTELSIQQKYGELGIVLMPADNSAGSRVAGATEIAELLGNPSEKSDEYIQPRLYVCRGCTGFIETLPYLEHDPNNLDDVEKVDTAEDGSGGDDSYDAARYGLYTPQISQMASNKR